MEHHLKEQVPQLLDEVVAGAFIDRLDDFVGFLDEIGSEGRTGLFTIPRTAAFAPETSHERQEGDETCAGGVSHGTIVSRTGIIHNPYGSL
jgi:hypothetical protein